MAKNRPPRIRANDDQPTPPDLANAEDASASTPAVTGRDDGYEVGYGKPPRHSQWQPGQSGNPRGREKGSRGLKTDMIAELETVMSVVINGKTEKGTRQRLMVKALAMRAAMGDIKATKILADMILLVLGVEDRGKGRAQLSTLDQALLDQLLADESDPSGKAGDEDLGDA